MQAAQGGSFFEPTALTDVTADMVIALWTNGDRLAQASHGLARNVLK